MRDPDRIRLWERAVAWWPTTAMISLGVAAWLAPLNLYGDSANDNLEWIFPSVYSIVAVSIAPVWIPFSFNNHHHAEDRLKAIHAGRVTRFRREVIQAAPSGEYVIVNHYLRKGLFAAPMHQHRAFHADDAEAIYAYVDKLRKGETKPQNSPEALAIAAVVNNNK